MEFRAFRPNGPLTGVIRVPGDKSLSHRAVLFAAMSEGTSRISGVLESADVLSTIDAIRALGADASLSPAADGLTGTITGWGTRGPVAPHKPIDCGNSGTTTRLLLGVLAGWPIAATLTGDASLSTRPMRRVTDPLAAMGAQFETVDGHLPVTVRGSALEPTTYESPVASAQVKTAILLAGLRASGTTTVVEPAPSRDHTERLLPAFGVDVVRDQARHAASVTGPANLSATDVTVPGDPSSAAFPAIAALLVPGSEVTITEVALNPTRIGFALVLERMGADLCIVPSSDRGAEPVGTLQVRYTPRLRATTVTAEEIPSLVDEIPILAVAAAAAGGTTRFEGVGELRVKESDRLEAIRAALTTLGITVRVEGDVLEIDGRGDSVAAGEAIFGSGVLDSLGDHRLAMAWAVAGLSSAGGITVRRFEAVEVSYPGFSQDMSALGAW